jgi:signal transduction histidine kinase
VTAKSRELGNLIDNLLVTARLENPQAALAAATTIDLGEAVGQAADRAWPRAILAKGDVQLQVPRRHVLVMANAEALGRILDNLIDNALAYAHGSPKVRLIVSDDKPIVRVEDNGVGIPAESRERIFERFFRVDGNGSSGSIGTGLGLYISRELATKYGGSLVLERSELGKGSTFALRLRSAEEPPDGAEDQSRDHRSSENNPSGRPSVIAEHRG